MFWCNTNFDDFLTEENFTHFRAQLIRDTRRFTFPDLTRFIKQTCIHRMGRIVSLSGNVKVELYSLVWMSQIKTIFDFSLFSVKTLQI